MDKLTQVIDMIEHPEHYSESQIKEILQDEESRQTYLTMMEMRMAFDKEATEKDLDVDKEWQLFAEQHPVVKSRFDWHKLAASFIGVCLLSGIAFAAIHTFSSHRQVEETSAGDTSQVKIASCPNTAVVSDKATSTDVKKEIVHKTFDNVSLETMLGEMFQNQEAKQLRFYYEWNSENCLQSVVDELNHSQQIILSLDNEQLVVE